MSPQQGHLIQAGTWQQHPVRLESASSSQSHSFGSTPSSSPCTRGIRATAKVEAIPAAAIMIHKEADLFLTSLK